jgi:hypothetical protein
VNGDRVRGTIEYYDTHLIKIVREGEPGLLIRKADIRLMHEDE